MYNDYEQYVMLTKDAKVFAENKVLVDLDRLDEMSDYHQVEEFISQNYGQLDERGLRLEFPQNIRLGIQKNSDAIEIVAVQGEYLIFSKGWRLVKKEDTK